AISVGRYLADALGLPPDRIILAGMGEDVPVADNSTIEGRALNRRVEVRVQCEKISEERSLQLVRDQSGEQKIETEGLRPGEGSAGDQVPTQVLSGDRMPEIDKAWVEKALPGLEWIWPQPSYGP